jgi:hypothetical protein
LPPAIFKHRETSQSSGGQPDKASQRAFPVGVTDDSREIGLASNAGGAMLI